jgi:predicted amidohydrolase
VLPVCIGGPTALEGLARLASDCGVNLLCGLEEDGQAQACFLFPDQGGGQARRLPLDRDAEEPAHLDLGPARVGLARAEDLMHPELALALAKRGCDLVAVSAGTLDADQVEVLSLRCLEKLAVVLAGRGLALIAAPPEGHQAGPLVRAAGEETCSLDLDTARTRNKAYEELIDFPRLLAPPSGPVQP